MTIKGIFISQNGDVQQVGDITSLQDIIAAMENILPQLITQEKQRIIAKLTNEDIKDILQKRVKQTEQLEP